MRSLCLIMVVGLAGCSSFGRPAFLVEMNGRKVGFEKFEAGKVPRGVEVTQFSPDSLSVQGEDPIQVNGVEVLASGDQVSIGGRKIAVDPDARIMVRKDGEVEVRLPARAEAAAAGPETAR